MSDIKSLFAEGYARGIAKLAWLGGLLMALLAIALVVNFWNAKNTYTRTPATITDIGISQHDETVWILKYTYPMGREQVKDSTSCPEEVAKRLRIGGTLLLLRDPDTGETLFADNEGYMKALSIKLGILGVLLVIGASVYLRLNPQ